MVESRSALTGTPYTPNADVDPRLEALAANVRARLRPTCADLPPAEFDALVRQIARRKLAWAVADETVPAPAAPREPPPDHPPR